MKPVATTTLRGILALLLAVLVTVGSEALARGAAACSRCVRHCPVASARLSCHSQPGKTPCHRSAPRWSSATCRHDADSPPPVRDLALLGAPPGASPGPAAVRLHAPAPAMPIVPSPEPPTDPPRGFVAA